MARVKVRTIERTEKITDSVSYRILTKQINIVRNSLSRAKYLNDVEKKTSLEKTLGNLVTAQEAFRTDFDTTQFNFLISSSADAISKMR